MLADIASPVYLGSPGLFLYSVISLAVIVLIEATVFRLLKWASWRVAFLHGFIINLVTSLIGTGIVIFVGRETFADNIPLPMLLIATFVLTVIIEAIELKVLRSAAPFSRVMLNSVVANLFSYAFVAAIIYLALFPPVIGYRGRNGPYWRPAPVSPPIPTPDSPSPTP
jgi:hypothetical protein